MFGFYALLGLIGGFAYFGIARRKREESTSALGPSRGIVYKLAALFAIDSFAGGFVVHSLLALWLFQRFDLSPGGGGCLLFLERGAFGLLLPGCRVDRKPHRTH